MTYDQAAVLLPNSVIEWSGVEFPDPCVIVKGESLHLSRLNDDGLGFKNIAKLIRERFLDAESTSN